VHDALGRRLGSNEVIGHLGKVRSTQLPGGQTVGSRGEAKVTADERDSFLHRRQPQLDHRRAEPTSNRRMDERFVSIVTRRYNAHAVSHLVPLDGRQGVQ
jgi:hypothetical protein